MNPVVGGRMAGKSGVRIKGHALYFREEGGVLPARCRCGANSGRALPTRAARTEWHRLHLERVLASRPHGEAYSKDVAQEAEITERQLDHWTTRGYLKALQREEVQGKSGAKRRWDASERFIAMTMGRLVRAGVEVEKAASVARRHVEHPTHTETYLLDAGIEIRIIDFVR